MRIDTTQQQPPHPSRVGRLLCIVLVAWLTSPLAARGAIDDAWAPKQGAAFNDPTGTTPTVLTDAVDAAIDQTPRGATIRIATFLFDKRTTTQKLVEAHRRGVNVRVVVDRAARSPQEDRLDRVFRTVRGGSSWLTWCKGSCRGTADDGRVHTKMYLFSQTGSASQVIMTGSANLNRGTAWRGWNDLYTVAGDDTLWHSFVGVFHGMSLDNDTPTGMVTVRSGDIKARFFPAATYDPTLRDLRHVRCNGATDGAGTDGHSEIWVNMFWIGGDRGRAIAEALLFKARHGCQVQFMVGAPSRVVMKLLRPAWRRGEISLWDTRQRRDELGKFTLRTHEKWIAISGNYRGDTSALAVTTGSQNWGPGSLAWGDDMTLTITDPAVFGDYVTNFQAITGASVEGFAPPHD